MTLTAPDHLRGRMTRYTPQEIRDERIAWVLARAAEGWTSPRIAAALGVDDSGLHSQMLAHGWRWWDHPRRITRRYRRRPGGEQ